MVDEKEFHRCCGEILRKRAAVEDWLEFFLSHYFCRLHTYRTFMFTELIATRMNFNQKKVVFHKICKRENVDKEKLESIKKSIEKVQEIGNDVAHNEAFIDSPTQENIALRHKRAIWKKEDRLEVNDILVQEVKKNYTTAIKGLLDLHEELDKKDKLLHPFNSNAFVKIVKKEDKFSDN
ncbi:MAG: hypothetical protein HYW27_02105 [Candidatus Aenigmarchaeota archaeon]|nr:hypothetical protein [Candidatus Aenigmarchaeota archaeon]